jgi:hypothetical protein
LSIPAKITEIVYGNKKLPHHDDPQVVATARQAQIRLLIAQAAEEKESQYVRPEVTVQAALVFILQVSKVQLRGEKLHQKIITHLVLHAETAGGPDGRLAPVEHGDVTAYIEGIRVTNALEIADGAASQAGIFIVIDNIFVDDRHSLPAGS